MLNSKFKSSFRALVGQSFLTGGMEHSQILSWSFSLPGAVNLKENFLCPVVVPQQCFKHSSEEFFWSFSFYWTSEAIENIKYMPVILPRVNFFFQFVQVATIISTHMCFFFFSRWTIGCCGWLPGCLYEVAMVFSSFYCIAMQLLRVKKVSKKLFVCFIECKLDWKPICFYLICPYIRWKWAAGSSFI